MIEIKAFEEDREVPVPCYTARVLAEVLSERSYQNKTWGTAFDDKNTLNDWVAYAVIYLGQAARMKAPPDEQRKGILKAATAAGGGDRGLRPQQQQLRPQALRPGEPRHDRGGRPVQGADKGMAATRRPCQGRQQRP